MANERIRVFISHSSRDKALVERLIDLLVAALHLPARAIRATSVDGHRLMGGANTERVLRREVEEADVLVGVLTPDSLDSLYVAFELGGRWVTGQPLILLLAPGADADLLEGPLGWLSALRCTPGELHQLVRELGEKLDVEPDRPDAYQRHIGRILEMEAAASTATPTASRWRRTRAVDVVSGAKDDADAEAVIEQKCARDWPEDYQMRLHAEKQQLDAYQELHPNH